MPKSADGRLRKIRYVLFAITAFLGYAVSASADVWQVGDETTYNQGVWGAPPDDVGALLLTAEFNTVYASTGGVIVGSASGFTMVFTDSAAVDAYIPTAGTYAPLDSSVLNPFANSTSSGASAGMCSHWNSTSIFRMQASFPQPPAFRSAISCLRGLPTCRSWTV
jgi:hypothetical protein